MVLRRRRASHSDNRSIEALDLPSAIASRFEALCRPASAEDIQAARPFVDARVSDLETAAAMFSDVDGRLASQIGRSLNGLIDDAASFDAQGRALVRAAVTYFGLHDTELFDVIPNGLRDHAQMVNAVCDALGRTDLRMAEAPPATHP